MMENAIIMASGLGSRMRPLTETTPKPLIPVHGTPMIETVLRGLTARGVDNIYIITGYLGEQFDYLKDCYPHVHLIANPVYATVNNISSVYTARSVLEQGDCFICEADLYVPDPSVFQAKLKESCYYGRMVPGHSEDWVFEQDEEGFITRVGKVGDNCYNMTGIAWLRSEDALILKAALEAVYGTPGYETLFWDDVVNLYLNRLRLRVHPIREGQIVEIDTAEELEAVNRRDFN